MPRDELLLIVENMYSQTYIAYSSYILCNADFKLVRHVSINELSNFFYNPDILNHIHENEEFTIEMLQDDPEQAKALLPFKYTIPFPATPAEFIDRVTRNKPIIFVMDMGKLKKLKHIDTPKINKDMIAFNELLTLIVIHNDLNAVRNITLKFLEVGAGDWGFSGSRDFD